MLEGGYIEEFIEDHPFSPFPQIINTERPDVAAANLLEGRVVILVDGTPFALVAPITFYSLFQAAEDYYQRFFWGRFVRWLRYALLLIALLLSLHLCGHSYLSSRDAANNPFIERCQV